jgi:hypothetical protein
MTNPQKGIWSFYNSRHDQSTMGIDPMNNISNNNKNSLCIYIISTIALNKKGILQQHQAREREDNIINNIKWLRGHHHQYHLGTLTGVCINHEKLIQVDIGGHPPLPNGSKQFFGNFGNLLFLAVFNFRGHFEGPNEGFSI